ncbi:MAG: DUF11 domain-containing protein [Firmicutes bacterium]|nr:DUF11 domain-containing protein [Bacillota bacterium]
MPIVSGVLYYDGNRTAAAATATGTIANVPIVMQNTVNGLAAAVLTSSTGTFQFTNVPSGSYQVVESYGWTYDDGTTPITIGTINWGTNAVPCMMLKGGTVPPLADDSHTYVTVSPTSTITNLDCTVRNTWLETVGVSDITNIAMLNGPVRYTPLVLASNIVVDSPNLVVAADNGTFGLFPPGIVANTGVTVTAPQTNPYPEIQSQFTYVMAATGTLQPVPDDGQYTVQNIMNNSHSNSNPTSPAWWRVADHTTGNETGRMMVINGYTQGTIIGQTTVLVNANTCYLTSYWVLNLCRQATGYINPEFSLLVTDQDGTTIYEHDFTDEILPNPECPEWRQIGTIFTTANDTTAVTIKFISQGGAATGNDFVLDDVALNSVDVLELDITKDASCSYATIGGTVYFGITISNPTNYLATQITLTDELDDILDELKFTLDGQNWLPWTGTLDIDDLEPGDSGDIIIQGKIKSGVSGTITNTASVQATFCEEEII